nr:zinc finger protein 736-like isoform X1 [Chrysemys picta bellii]
MPCTYTFFNPFHCRRQVTEELACTQVLLYEQREETVSCAIWAFLSEQEDTVSNDETITLPELYICFVHNIMSQFNNTIKVLESDYIQVTDLYAIFNKLRREIQIRQEQGFYGYKVTQFLKKLPPNEQNKFVGDAQQVYTRMLQYLEKWFDFSENSFYMLCAPLSLNGPLELDKLCALTTNLDIQVDGDELFTEMCTLNDVLPTLKRLTNDTELTLCQEQQEHHHQINVSEVWVEFFKHSEAPSLLKIVQHVLAIPPGNAFVEHIFSVMKNLWTDERNQLKVDLVKAELFVHFNYKMTCAKFAGFLKTEAAKELVVAARKEQKYKSGEGMMSENVEENPQQEDPETHVTLLGRSEGTVSWSPEHGKAGGCQHRPERQQGNQSGKKVGKSIQCEGGLKNLSKNMMHQRFSNGEGKYTCTECGKSFSQSLHIIHCRTHTGQRPHKCLQCGKSFIDNPTLKIHQRIHMGEKPYKCPDCGKSFSERPHLIGHQRIHTEAKTFICSQCGETLCNWSTFLRHERIHTGERSKPYRCLECRENFRDWSGLSRHQRIHTGENPITAWTVEKASVGTQTLPGTKKLTLGRDPISASSVGKASVRNQPAVDI